MTATQLSLSEMGISKQTIARLNAIATGQRMSLRDYVRKLLNKEAASYENSSPSEDPWFDNPENVRMIEEAEAEYERLEDKSLLVTFRSPEDIDKFIQAVENEQ